MWFAGNPAPFVMELPAYRMPALTGVLHSMWERGWSFVKRAGTIIMLAVVGVWFLSSFGLTENGVGMVENVSDGFLAGVGRSVSWIFTPLGFGEWRATVAAFTGLIAKENVVGTLGVLYGFAEVAEDGAEMWGSMAGSFTRLSAYSFLVFNLLCAPCFAAIGAIRREMNSPKWTILAISYQTAFAYGAALCTYQFGQLFDAGQFGAGAAAACAVLACFLFLLLRPGKSDSSLQVKTSAAS
jgi:ferrous iron transport protein B